MGHRLASSSMIEVAVVEKYTGMEMARSERRGSSLRQEMPKVLALLHQFLGNGLFNTNSVVQHVCK